MSARQGDGQGDYRIFVGAFPAGELAETIQALRRRYDPKTARITPPHVTLAGTYWHRGPATPENETHAIEQLQAVQGSLAPFELVLGGIRTFPPEHNPVIYLGVELSEELLAVRRVLMAALGPDKHRQFTPHLTLAMRLASTTAQAMLRDLNPSRWHTGVFRAPVEELWLMQRGPQDPAWRRIYRLPLIAPVALP